MKVVNQCPSDGHRMAFCSMWLGGCHQKVTNQTESWKEYLLLLLVVCPICPPEKDGLEMLPISGSECRKNVRNPTEILGTPAFKASTHRKYHAPATCVCSIRTSEPGTKGEEGEKPVCLHVVSNQF